MSIKMIWKVILLLYFLYVTSGKHVKLKSEDYPTLKWPSKYSVEARKYYMSSGLIEHFKYWRTGVSSRIEDNEGAVIKIVRGKRLSFGDRYEIHSETTEEETNKIVCVKEKPSFFSPDNILPSSLSDLTPKGPDNVKGVNCVKFTNEGDIDKQNEKTLWAYFNGTVERWVPVRYTTKGIDDWHGYFTDYEIWDFFNFKHKVDMGAFKVTYNCTTKDKDDDHNEPTSKLSIIDDDDPYSLNHDEKKELDAAFIKYKRRFDKQYENKDEHEMRRRIFFKNWRLVTGKNNKNLGYTLALNKLSDRTDKEIKKYGGLRRNKPSTPGNIPFPYSEKKLKKFAETLPKEYDLRLEGLVGPVLREHECKSSWAFAATAVVEGALARSNGGTWMKLSEQALLDCTWGFGNKGCEGGTVTDSYQWIMEHGLPTQQHYGSYANKNGFCKMENMTETYKIKGYTDVTPLSVEALKIALVNHGPVAVKINFHYLLHMYDGGIFYDPDCDPSPENLDYTMTVVGYGEKDGDTFWILKSSRGPYWGIDGYIHISVRDNNCGVMTEPTYAVA